MATPYEGTLHLLPPQFHPTNLLLQVEHGIKDAPKPRTRRPSMSSFFNQLSQISTDDSSPSYPHNNPHATPTPVDVAAASRLLQDQFLSLRQAAPTEENLAFLDLLIEATQRSIDDPPAKVEGVPQSYLDSLDRVDRKYLKKTDTCPICGEAFLVGPSLTPECFYCSLVALSSLDNFRE